jgi:hypothetical protein
VFFEQKILAYKSVKSAKLKEHLTCGHPENASKDVGFIMQRKLSSEKLGTFQNLDLPFHKNLFLKHPIKLLIGLPNKTSSTLW